MSTPLESFESISWVTGGTPDSILYEGLGIACFVSKFMSFMVWRIFTFEYSS
jgi:hypothetical protein